MVVNPRFYYKVSKYGKERIYEKYRNNGTITEDDEKLIREYVGEKITQEHITEIRELRIITTLCLWQYHIKKEYKNLDIATVNNAIDNIWKAKTILNDAFTDKPLKQNTIRDYIAKLKPFLLWLIENKYSKLPEKKILKIKIPKKDDETTAPDDLPTYDEVLQIIEHCHKPIHKAFMYVLYESGCRIGELCRLTWNDVKFEKVGEQKNENGEIISEGVNTVALSIEDTKEKKKKHTRLVESTEALAQFKNTYKELYGSCEPSKDKKGKPIIDNFVFVSQGRTPMTYPTALQMFNQAIKRSGITKHVTPHDFRRCRATHMVQLGYSDSVIKLTLWDNINSTQFKVYVKLASSAIDRELLAKHGIKLDKDQEIKTTARTCDNCHTINSTKNAFCGKCGYPLSEDAIKQSKTADQVLDEWLNNPENLKKLLARIEAAK